MCLGYGIFEVRFRFVVMKMPIFLSDTGMTKEWNVIAVIFCLLHTLTALCLDGINNVFTVDSYGSEQFPVRVRNVTILVYDIHNRPSCHHGKVNVVMPGYFHIISGEVVTPKDFDLFSSNLVRATVRYGNMKICDNGESHMIIVPTRLWRLSHIFVRCFGLLHFFHKIFSELQKKVNFNPKLELPPSPSFLGVTLLDILKGDYYIKIAVDSNHERIVQFAIPSGFSALMMGLTPD
ncbi:unnamed protein product [Angiostrongylus costaricensis]|uniref:DUF1573 domain-containing protein n=1 Tax=Angiostrongylus costaricensis TaxID=334426 RepID=A0A0R3P9U7_ANGCS|nr:unnamed protein product [Angiostrongylus costaricensis]